MQIIYHIVKSEKKTIFTNASGKFRGIITTVNMTNDTHT